MDANRGSLIGSMYEICYCNLYLGLEILLCGFEFAFGLVMNKLGFLILRNLIHEVNIMPLQALCISLFLCKSLLRSWGF